MNGKQLDIITLLESVGYTVEFDQSGLDGNLIPRDPNLPKAEIHLPDPDETCTDFRMEILTLAGDISRDILLFVSAFNWECVFGKVVYHRDGNRLCFQRIWEGEPTDFEPEEFHMDVMEAACYSVCLERVIRMMESGELNADEASEVLESLLERLAHAEGCDCDDSDCTDCHH